MLFAGALLLALLPGSAAAAGPTGRTTGALPDRIAAEKLATPITATKAEASAVVDAMVARASGRQDVIVRLSARPLAEVMGASAATQIQARSVIRAQQASVIATAKAADSKATVLGRTRNASNLVMLNVDSAAIKMLARSRSVVSIKPVKDYALDLSETVPYIGATTVQNAGYKGKGAKVAIFDTGVDYTHKALGGAGTEAAYLAAYGTGPTDPANTVAPTWPAGRISGGYDFVGESWPTGDLAPDPDPIDSPAANTALGVSYHTTGGHGTHVSDIVGGIKGVAPKATMYVVKVCSSVSTSCSGVAMIEAMDWAMDPNGDGYFGDHVDIVNMSIGSDYGTVYDDDLSLAVDRASFYAGILTVASAGNGANRPYITGTPASAASALSVAQTQMPSAKRSPLVVNAPAAIAGYYGNIETMEWAPLGAGFSGDVVYIGRGCPASEVGTDDPYLASPAGKVALIDRGACSISSKVDRAAKAGATAVLLGLVAPGDAVSFSQGSGNTFVPTVVIQQSLNLDIQDQLSLPTTVTVSISTANQKPLVRGMAGTSSRGPSSDNTIKPEIGAPGASISAVSGSFTGTEGFGGTSGAAPMVTGSAALLKGAFPGRTAIEIKAMLMNNAEMQIYTDRVTYPGVLAPITRIGSGEVRVFRAFRAPFAVWDATAKTSALSFGFVDGNKNYSATRQLTLKNYSNARLELKVTPTFRYANDKANGAVSIIAPSKVILPPRGKTTINVTVKVNASKLRLWTMNGGSGGISPAELDLLEYDGFVTFDRIGFTPDNTQPVHVPWQVLPRLAGNVSLTTAPVPGVTTGVLANTGAGPAAVNLYSLVGVSPKLPRAARGSNAPVIDLKAVGVETFPVPSGFCSASASFVYEIAVAKWDRQTTSVVPGEIDVDIDTNGDGTPDYTVFTAPQSLYASPIVGQSLVWVWDHSDDSVGAMFYTSQSTNDSNVVMDFCGEQIGMNASNFGDPLTLDVYGVDWYYQAAVTDAIMAIHVTPMGERFWAPVSDIDPASTTDLDVEDFGAVDTNPSETGLLLVLNGDRTDYFGGAPKGNESMQIPLIP
jgi:subtilisin family serine protease